MLTTFQVEEKKKKQASQAMQNYSFFNQSKQRGKNQFELTTLSM